MNSAEHFDQLELRDPGEREADLMSRLPGVLAAAMRAPAHAERLQGVDPNAITSRAALAELPLLRKSDLPGLHAANPPFGGFVAEPLATFGRLFTSPGPIFEAELAEEDPWRCARGLFAAGFRRGDVVLNTFSYHLTPGGFILDSAARALGCPVIPAGPGNTEQQLEIIAAFKPVAYCGVPDFLKILLDAGSSAGRDTGSIRKAVMSGAAFPKTLQDEFAARGVQARQIYATADLGLIAYESRTGEGLVVNEDIILEVVRPGTGDPVGGDEVGEVVVTSLNARFPWVRLALGDLTAVGAGQSACGRTNTRIKGWLGRADQTTKIRGIFVRPEQIADIARRHPEFQRLRLVVARDRETDTMTLRAEAGTNDASLVEALAKTLHSVTKLNGRAEIVPPGSLPNDGKVISDERTHD